MQTVTRFFAYIVPILCMPVVSAFAQVGNCESAEASAILDIGNVRAQIYNNGPLFWKGDQNVYEVPKGGGVNAIFASALLIAGLIDEDLRVAGSTYGPYEFWPGPLDEAGNPPEDCSEFDQLWEIRSEDFEQFETDGTFSNRMQSWPWQLGAPVIDGDGISDNYNLEGGDRPELLGDQTLWWVMNDRGNIHGASEVDPIGIEVRGTAYAFADPAAGNITFYRYQLTNRNTAHLTDAFLSMFVDADLGNLADDYIGSDSLLHLAYSFNGDPLDEGGYEGQPPAIGYAFLVTPEAPQDNYDNDRDGEIDEPEESVGVYSVIHFPDGRFASLNPNGEQIYNFMRGFWKDGLPLTEGGDGRSYSDIRTRFVFPADPTTQTYWSELRPIPEGDPNQPTDRTFAISSGPFNLPPGASTEFLIAVVSVQGDDNLDSAGKLIELVRNIQLDPERFLASGYQPGQSTQITQTPRYVLGFDQNFPNPFSGSTTFRYSLPKEMQVRLSVFDMLGRELEVLVEAAQGPGIYTMEFDGSGLPAGIYYAHIVLDHLSFTKKMVLLP